MDTAVSIRPADSADLAAIADIYAHHVLHGLGTFETDPPTVAEISRRLGQVRARGMPWLVATHGKQVVGYAYAAPFRERAAFARTVEDSIYLHPDFFGRGIGRLLLSSVIAGCATAGLRQMVAMIGDSDNQRSIRLHRSLGFRQVGVLQAVGFKHQRWVDVVLMQLELGG